MAIEFVIVVAGVFLGMQVSNWNEARVEGGRAHAYLVRIQSDLEADVSAMEGRRVFIGRALDYAHQALAYAESGELADGSAWKTVLAFYQASQISGTAFSDATYREMTSAGDLRLIRDERLSVELASYYANTGEGALPSLFNQLPAYRETVRGLIPSAVQDYIWANCYRNHPDLRQEMIDCAAPISDAQARAILADLHADPQVLRQLRFWATQMRVVVMATTGERDVAAQLAADVGRRIGPGGRPH